MHFSTFLSAVWEREGERERERGRGREWQRRCKGQHFCLGSLSLSISTQGRGGRALWSLGINQHSLGSLAALWPGMLNANIIIRFLQIVTWCMYNINGSVGLTSNVNLLEIDPGMNFNSLCYLRYNLARDRRHRPSLFGRKLEPTEWGFHDEIEFPDISSVTSIMMTLIFQKLQTEITWF